MEVIANGQIPGTFPGVIPAFNLIKTDMKGADAASTRQMFFQFLDANYIGAGTSGSVGDNAGYINSLPSIWGEVGLSSTSQIALLSDVGLAIGVSNFSSNYGPISFSDGRPVNGWSNFNSPDDGGLFISLSPSSADLSVSYATSNYDKGIFLEANFASRGVLNVFFSNTSEIYFFHTAGFNAPFGPLGKGLRHVLIKAFCEQFQIYCLRSKISTAQGTVENAAGGIAPNCKVYMFRRSDGKLLGRAVSDQNGHYEMHTSAISGDTVFMVCLDDDNAPDFEGIIYDRITV